MSRKQTRRHFFNQTSAASLGLLSVPALASGTIKHPAGEPVWKNWKEGMQYRPLGRTGMMVSEIVLGTFSFTTEDSFDVFDESIVRGVNYIDCAAAYAQGKAETNLGNYLKKSGNRDKIFLATKLSGFFFLKGWHHTTV